MAYGDNYSYDIRSIEDAAGEIIETVRHEGKIGKEYLVGILNIVRGIGYREGKASEKKRIIELLKLE